MVQQGSVLALLRGASMRGDTHNRILVRVMLDNEHGPRTLYYVCQSVLEAMRHAATKSESVRRLHGEKLGEPIFIEGKSND
jgi:hypothetical protein